MQFKPSYGNSMIVILEEIKHHLASSFCVQNWKIETPVCEGLLHIMYVAV